MTKNLTTATGGLDSVVLGHREDLTNDPMTVRSYVREIAARLEARRIG